MERKYCHIRWWGCPSDNFVEGFSIYPYSRWQIRNWLRFYIRRPRTFWNIRYEDLDHLLSDFSMREISPIELSAFTSLEPLNLVGNAWGTFPEEFFEGMDEWLANEATIIPIQNEIRGIMKSGDSTISPYMKPSASNRSLYFIKEIKGNFVRLLDGTEVRVCSLHVPNQHHRIEINRDHIIKQGWECHACNGKLAIDRDRPRYILNTTSGYLRDHPTFDEDGKIKLHTVRITPNENQASIWCGHHGSAIVDSGSPYQVRMRVANASMQKKHDGVCDRCCAIIESKNKIGD